MPGPDKYYEIRPLPLSEDVMVKHEISPAMQEGLEWVQHHEEDLGKDPDFDFHKPVGKFLQEIDPKDFSPPAQAKFLLESGMMEHYIDLVHHNPDIRTDVLRWVMRQVPGGMIHVADPNNGWLNTQLREGDHNNPDNVTTRSGVYMYGLLDGRPDLSEGVTLQRTVAQLSLELAKTESVHGDKMVRYVHIPPSPTQKQRDIALAAKTYGEKAANVELDWQKKNRKLADITTAYAGGQQNRDALVRVISGEMKHRKCAIEIGNMTVRLFRGNEYMDVTVNQFLSVADTGKDPIGTLLDGRTNNLPGVDAEWKQLSELPSVKDDTVVFSVSSGGYPRPDSKVLEYGRSGRSVTHVHLNREHPKGRMVELYQSHVSADGVPEKAIAFAVGRRLESYQQVSPVERISWYPPTKTGDLPTPEELETLNAALLKPEEGKSPNDMPEMQKLVRALGLSDVLITGSVPEKAQQAIVAFAEELDNRTMAPLREKLKAMMARDGVSEAAQKIVINRLITTSITPTKAFDLLARLYFGPTAVCGQSYEPAMGVQLTIAPPVHHQMHEELLEAIENGHFHPETLFTRPEGVLKAQLEEQGIPESRYPSWLADQITQAAKQMAAEYSLLYVGCPTLMTFTEITDGWRQYAQGGASIFTPDLAEETKLRLQHSAIGSNAAEVDGKTVYIAEFESALANEDKLAAAWATLDRMKGKTLDGIGSEFRYQMTPELLQSLDISSDEFRVLIAPRIAVLAAPGDKLRQRIIHREIDRTLKVWDRLVARGTGQGTLNAFGRNLLAQIGITQEVPSYTPAFVAAQILHEDPVALPGLQYLLLGGLYGFTQRFYYAGEMSANRFRTLLRQPQGT